VESISKRIVVRNKVGHLHVLKRKQLRLLSFYAYSSTRTIWNQKNGVIAWDDGIYPRSEMDTDSQKRLVEQIEGFIKNLGDLSTGEARKLLKFFDRLQKLV
jgi:hypothetical protein